MEMPQERISFKRAGPSFPGSVKSRRTASYWPVLRAARPVGPSAQTSASYQCCFNSSCMEAASRSVSFMRRIFMLSCLFSGTELLLIFGLSTPKVKAWDA